MAEETEQLEKTVKSEILKETPFGADDDIVSQISDMFSGKNSHQGIQTDDDDETMVIETEQKLADALNGKKNLGANTTSSQSVQQKTTKKSTTDDENDNGENLEDDDETDPLEEDGQGNVKLKKDVFASKNKSTEQVTDKTVLPVLSKAFNIDLTEEGGAQKLVASINKIRKAAQEAEVVKTEVKEYKEFLAGLPQKLKASMLAFNKGEDWEAQLGTASPDAIDFNADFEKLDDAKKVETINKLVGGQFKELKDVPAASLNAVKNIFETQKSLSSKQTEIEKQKTASQKAAFDSALSSAVEAFKEDFPDFDKVLIRNMAKKLESGDFRNYFFDKEGKPLKSAVKRLTLAVVAEEKINQLEEELAVLKGSKKKGEKIVKQQTTPVVKRQQSNDQVLPKEVEEEISGLVGMLKNQNLTY